MSADYRIDVEVFGQAAEFRAAMASSSRSARETGGYIAALKRELKQLTEQTNQAARAALEEAKAQKISADAALNDADRKALNRAERKRWREEIAKDTRTLFEENAALYAGAGAIKEHTKQTRDGTEATDIYAAAAQRAKDNLDQEMRSATLAALGLREKGKESRKTAEYQDLLAHAAHEVTAALEEEAAAAGTAALGLREKGKESRKTAVEQGALTHTAHEAAIALEEETVAADQNARALRRVAEEHGRSRGVLLANARSQPLMAAAIAGVTLAIGPLSSLLFDSAAGAGALVAALNPLIGALVLIPAAAGAAGQGLGVLALGFHGVFKTLTAQGVTFQHDLQKLTKPAQEFVKLLRGGPIGNAFKELQLQVQTGLFPGIVAGLKSMVGAFKPFSQVMYDTAKAISHLFDQFGRLVGSKEFSHTLLDVGERNRQTIYRLGEAAIHAADGITHIVAAAGPFIGEVTDGIRKAATAFDDWTKGAQKDGSIAGFLKETAYRAGQFLNILHSIFTFWTGFSAAAAPLTNALMDAWVKGAAAAADWAQHSGALRTFFQNALTPLQHVGALLGNLVRDLAVLAQDNQGNLTHLADTLRTKLLPVLNQLATWISNHLLPPLLNMLDHIIPAVGAVLKHVVEPILKDLLAVIKPLVNGLADFITEANKLGSIPGAISALAVGAAVFASWKGLIALWKAAQAEAIILAASSDAITGIPLVGGAIRGKGVKVAANKIVQQEAKSTLAASFEGTAGGLGAASLIRSAAGPAARSAFFSLPMSGAIGAGASQLLGGVRAGLGAALSHAPLIAAGATAVDAVIRGIKGESASNASMHALGDAANAISFGLIPKPTDFTKHDKVIVDDVNRINDLANAAAKDRKLGFHLNVDLKPGAKETVNRVLQDVIASLASATDDIRSKTESWSGYLDLMRTRLSLAMKQMRVDVQAGKITNEDAAQAMTDAYASAANSIIASIQKTGKATKEAIAQYDAYFSKVLAHYGMTPADIKQELTIRNYAATHKGDRGTGQANLATGGWVGRAGEVSGDVVPAMLGRGEAVLNRHQQGPVNAALQAAYGIDLAGLFGSISTPHYLAGGGFVPAPGTNFSQGSEPELAQRLGRLASFLNTTIYGISGARSPARSVEVGGFANDPHTRGEAADIGVGSMLRSSAGRLSEALLERFGLTRPFGGPSEINHIQLLHGASVALGKMLASAKTGSADKLPGLPNAFVKGGGDLGAIANLSIDALRSIIKGISRGGGVGGVGGSNSSNRKLGEQMMHAFGFGQNQWPFLDKLWNRESGWDANAVNKSSGAYGIPQSLGHGHPYPLGAPRPQIAWGLRYIKNRYVTPASAWAHEQAAGWYASGGFVGEPVASAAGRTPPPNIPLNQGASAPTKQTTANKKKWHRNPVTGQYGWFTDAQFRALQVQSTKMRGHHAGPKGPTGPPPLGQRRQHHRQRAKVRHTGPFRRLARQVKHLGGDPLAGLVDYSPADATVQDLRNQLTNMQGQHNLTDESQFRDALFKVGTDIEVAPMAVYDPSQFEIRSILNWNGGVDASSLTSIGGINQHVSELRDELGIDNLIGGAMDTEYSEMLGRNKGASARLVERLKLLEELRSIAWTSKQIVAINQATYKRETSSVGTWQDRLRGNTEEIQTLQDWMRHNSGANSDQAKQFKSTARDRIVSLQRKNTYLKKHKPPVSTLQRESLANINLWSGELNTYVGDSTSAIPKSIAGWSPGGGWAAAISDQIGTLRTETQAIAQDAGQLVNVNKPALELDIDSLNKEIAQWLGTTLQSQARSGGGTSGTSTELVDLLQAQLTQALQSAALQSAQFGVFQGLAPWIGRFQHGAMYVPRSGLAWLERGEQVIPEMDGPNPRYDLKRQPPAASPTTVELHLHGHASQLVKLIDTRVDARAPVIVRQKLGKSAVTLAGAPGRG